MSKYAAYAEGVDGLILAAGNRLAVQAVQMNRENVQISPSQNGQIEQNYQKPEIYEAVEAIRVPTQKVAPHQEPATQNYMNHVYDKIPDPRNLEPQLPARPQSAQIQNPFVQLPTHQNPPEPVYYPPTSRQKSTSPKPISTQSSKRFDKAIKSVTGKHPTQHPSDGVTNHEKTGSGNSTGSRFAKNAKQHPKKRNEELNAQQREIQEQLDAMRDEEIIELQQKGDNMKSYEKERLEQLMSEREFARQYKTEQASVEELIGGNIQVLDNVDDLDYVPDRPDKDRLMNQKFKASQDCLNQGEGVSVDEITVLSPEILQNPEIYVENVSENHKANEIQTEYIKRREERASERERLRNEREQTERELAALKLGSSIQKYQYRGSSSPQPPVSVPEVKKPEVYGELVNKFKKPNSYTPNTYRVVLQKFHENGRNGETVQNFDFLDPTRPKIACFGPKTT